MAFRRRPPHAAARLAAIAVLLATAAGMAALAAGSSVEGTWRLATQRYEAGANDLSRHFAGELRLSVEPGPRVTIQVEGFGAALEWPAFVSERGVHRVETHEREVSTDAIRASYTVSIDELEPSAMRVEERYTLSPDGSTLTGTMRITLRRAGEDGGGFVLHRTFERVP